MRLRGEVERARLADAPHLDVLRGALPDRYALVWQVRQDDERGFALMLDRIQLNAELLDLLGSRAVRLLDRSRILPASLRARDLVARRILQALQSLDLGDEPATRGFERRDALERLVGVEPAVFQSSPDTLDVVA